MSVNLFISNTSKKATSLAIGNLRWRLPLATNVIVIVPERHSLDTEKQIYDELGLDGSCNIDVVSFARLALKVTKDTLAQPLSREGGVILLDKLIKENAGSLGYYAAMAGKVKFASEMLSALDSLKTSGINPHELQTVAPLLQQGQKLADIALLYQAYDDALKGKYSDALSRMDALIGVIGESELIAKSDIYILGQNFFDNKQRQVIENLIKYAHSFNIALCEPWHNRYFQEMSARKMIMALAQKTGKKAGVASKDVALPEPISSLCANLYTYEKADSVCCGDRLELCYESNPYEEIKGIAKQIKAQVRGGGYRYKDFGLICPSEFYKSIIEDIFTRYDIPIYIDIKYPIYKDVFTTFLLHALEASFAPRQRNMTTLAKHPFLAMAGAEFEDYCLKYNIDYDYFLTPFEFGQEDKDKAEAVRLALVGVLRPLRESMGTYQEIGKNTIAFIDFYLERHKEFLQKAGLDASSINASSQVPEKIKNIIQESSLILQDSPCSMQEFYAMLSAALIEVKISVVPQYIDAVFAGGLQESSYNNFKVLFFVGANQGAYPSVPVSQGIINLYDIDSLAQHDLAIYPAPLKVMEREKFIILDTLSKAIEKVYISCCAIDFAGGELKKGDLYRDALLLTDAREISLLDKFKKNAYNSNKDFLFFAVNSRNLFYEYISLLKDETISPFENVLVEHLRKSGYGEWLDKIRKKDSVIDNPLDCFFRKENNVYTSSVSQLECYFNCPYMHYFSYGLRLKKKDTGPHDARDIGIIIHQVLEEYFRDYKDAIRSASDREISANSEAVIDRVLSEPQFQARMTTPLGNHLYNIIRDECKKALFTLSKNIQMGAYTPKYIELSFGKDKEYKGIELDVSGERFLLRGKIDRVDKYKDNIIIIDYKTGASINCEYDSLYYGTKIQLFIYLKAFLDKGLTPRGVFYLPISLNYSSADITPFLLRGFFDPSEEGIQLLDAQAAASENKTASSVAAFTVERNKEGELKSTNNSSSRPLNGEEFESIVNYVLEVSTQALDEIKQGFIKRRPLSSGYMSPCTYCDYASICGDIPSIRDKNGVKKENLLAND